MRDDQPIPCKVGLRCTDPENCDHTFRHPDQSVNRLHPDDWFAEPDRADYPKTGAGELQYANDSIDAARRTARAQWACKLDCPQEQRLRCLHIGLQPGPTLTHGVYGGYTPAQRQAIVRERDAKKASPGGTDR